MLDENEFIEVEKGHLIDLDNIYDTIMNCYNKSKSTKGYTFEELVNINEKEYKCKIRVRPPEFIISINNNKEKKIKFPPLTIKFSKKTNKTKIIYTLEQLKKCINIYKYERPKLLVNNIKNDINDFYSIKYIYTDAEVKDEENDEEIYKNIVKYKSIEYSNTIKLQLSEFPSNFNDYFKSDNINDNSEFEFYMPLIRANFIAEIIIGLKDNNQLFITGIHGIGKSLTLFMLKFFYFPNIYVYLNLDIIKTKKSDEWKKIVKYEFAYIFESVEDFTTFFNDNFIKNSIDYLLIIYTILSKLNNMKFNKQFYIIIDQYKKEKDINNSLGKIKEIIMQNKNMKLIVCSSIDDDSLREELIQRIVNETSEMKDYLYIRKNLCYIYSNENEKKNKPLESILNLFNYLPLYQSCFFQKSPEEYENIKLKIIQKDINDIKEYFSNRGINYLEGIHQIKSHINKLLSLDDFRVSEQYFTMKYFEFYKITRENVLQIKLNFPNHNIKENDINKYIISYSFPFLEKILNEFKNNEYEKIINQGFFEDQKCGTKGNLYEFLVINYFINNLNSNIFNGLFEKITKVIEIYSPFDILDKKEKNSIYSQSIREYEETNANDVILFIFKFEYVSRYDAMIFIKRNNTSILLQITNHKKFDNLKCYLDESITNKDAENIENEFLKVYEMNIQSIYLYFIINPKETSIEELKQNYVNNSLSFFLYNFEEKIFYKLNREYQLEKVNKIEFSKSNNLMIKSNKDKYIQEISLDFKKNEEIKNEVINNFLNKKRRKAFYIKKNDTKYLNKYTTDIIYMNEFNLFIYSIYKTTRFHISFSSLISYYQPFLISHDNIIVRIINKDKDKDFDCIFHNTKDRITIFNVKTKKIEQSYDLVRPYYELENYQIIAFLVEFRNKK